MSLRQALKRSREEQERSGALVERRLGGVVWFEAPKPQRPPQIYREGPVNGSTDLYGAAPRGTAKPDLSVEWSKQPEDDRENDLVGRRATRVWVKEGRRVQIRCKVAGVCDVDRCRFYLCEDADDDIQTVLDAKTCKDAVDAADEALQEAKEKRLKREKQLRKEERLRIEKDAREAADAADAAMEAEEKRWFFRCPCGIEGSQYDDGKDMVQCASCYDWAHDSCVVSRLRGFRGASKLGALRQCSYLCVRCAPKRYRTKACSCKVDERCANCTSTVTLRPPTKTKNAKTFHDALPELRIYTDPRRRDSTIVQEVITGGCYERPARDFEVLPGDRWLDIGAHIGAFSGVCLAAGADVVAVEPDADNFRLLEYNGSLRHVLDPCPGTFIAIKKAVVGSDDTECTLYAHPQACAFRHSTERLALAQRRGLTETAWQGSTVEATSLTKLLEQYPDINGVKVDAQGAEVDIVAAVRDWRSVEKLVLEYDFEYRPSLRAFHAFVEDLRKHFPSVQHAKLKKTGDFVGFPNGVLVFATREASSLARRVTL